MKKFTHYLRSAGSDIPSSIVVFLVALPLCLGIALGSQAPLFSGLIAGIVGGIVIGLLSGSQLSVSGPAAGLTTIVAATIGKMPAYEAFLLGVVLCGFFQLLLGFLKAGIIGDYVPYCVIKGMLAAIGITLILKQLPHLVGYDKDFEGDQAFLQTDQENTFSEIARSLAFLSPVAVLIGGLSLVLQVSWEKYSSRWKGIVKLVPAPLLVVFLGVGINEFFKARGSAYTIDPEHMVNIPVAASTTEFFSFFRFPDFSFISNAEIWLTGITLALVASLETLLSVEAVDDLDPYQRVTPTNRELKAQGIGNIVSGMLGGLPVTSVIVRSSANVNAGAKTKMSAVYHGIFLLASVAFIPQILNLIPKSALAAILIYIGFKLARPSLFKMHYKKGFDQFIPFTVTIFAILFTDLLKGVLIGIVVGLFFVIRSNFKTAVFVVHDRNKYLFRLRKDVSFLNKPYIKNRLEKVPENAFVLIDAGRADFIDKDIIEVIEDFMKHASLKNITVELKRNMYREQGFSIPLTEPAGAGYARLNRAAFQAIDSND